MKYSVCVLLLFWVACSSSSQKRSIPEPEPPRKIHLGVFQRMKLPKEYANAYRVLTDPKEELIFGDVCGVGGEIPPGGLEYTRLNKLGRKDVFLNILKGPNIVGRMYALKGLYELQTSGITLTKEESELVEKVLQIPVMFESCSGCNGQYSTYKQEYEYLKETYPIASPGR